MTDDKDLQQLTALENHWSEPSHSWGDQQSAEEENIMYGEEDAEFVVGLLTIYIDVRDFSAEKIEKEFMDKNANLFDRLANQGIEVLILRNVKYSGDMGVRLDYVKFE